MITEVVVCVAKNDVECHSAIQFAKILPSVSTTLALGRAPPSEVPGSINWSSQQTSPTVWEGVLDKTEYIITSTRILQRRDVHQISAQQNAAILLNLVLELLRSDTITIFKKLHRRHCSRKKISPWNLENAQMFLQKQQMNQSELDSMFWLLEICN